MKLREFECCYIHGGSAYTLSVWVANAKAARESVAAYALETHGPGCAVRSIKPASR